MMRLTLRAIQVLTTSVQHFLGGLRPPSAAFFGPKVLFILEGREWLDLRNVLKKAFQKHSINMMVDDIHEAAEKFSGILKRYAAEGGWLCDDERGGPEERTNKKNCVGADVDFMRLVACYHIDAIGKVCFHSDLRALETFEQGPNVIEESFEYLLEVSRRAIFLLLVT